MTLNSPERRNAISADMADQLIEACEKIDANRQIGAVVIRGAGGSFCAGADRSLLAASGEDPAHDDNFQRTSLIYRSFMRVGALEPVTIAAVRGAAVGAGLNLALATDIRVVANDARLISGFLSLGVHPGGGHYVLLARSTNRDTAAVLGLCRQELSGREACDRGLAWAAVDDAEVEQRAVELARAAAQDPALTRAATRSFRKEAGPPVQDWETGLELERGIQMWSFRRKGGPSWGDSKIGFGRKANTSPG